MFDWDRFKNGEFVVTFGKEEDAKDFLKECDKRDIKWRDGTKATDFENFWNGNSNLYFEFSKLPNGICYGRTNLRAIEERMIVKWEVKEMKELTFKEVIANIKEGEVWEALSVKIRKDSFGIQLNGLGGNATISDNFRFKLKRKEYTFEEAFKAYEEGKAIESFKGTSYVKHYEEEYFEKISIEEIRGKWYIND